MNRMMKVMAMVVVGMGMLAAYGHEFTGFLTGTDQLVYPGKTVGELYESGTVFKSVCQGASWSSPTDAYATQVQKYPADATGADIQKLLLTFTFLQHTPYQWCKGAIAVLSNGPDGVMAKAVTGFYSQYREWEFYYGCRFNASGVPEKYQPTTGGGWYDAATTATGSGIGLNGIKFIEGATAGYVDSLPAAVDHNFPGDITATDQLVYPGKTVGELYESGCAFRSMCFGKAWTTPIESFATQVQKYPADATGSDIQKLLLTFTFLQESPAWCKGTIAVLSNGPGGVMMKSVTGFYTPYNDRANYYGCRFDANGNPEKYQTGSGGGWYNAVASQNASIGLLGIRFCAQAKPITPSLLNFTQFIGTTPVLVSAGNALSLATIHDRFQNGELYLSTRLSHGAGAETGQNLPAYFVQKYPATATGDDIQKLLVTFTFYGTFEWNKGVVLILSKDEDGIYAQNLSGFYADNHSDQRTTKPYAAFDANGNAALSGVTGSYAATDDASSTTAGRYGATGLAIGAIATDAPLLFAGKTIDEVLSAPILARICGGSAGAGTGFTKYAYASLDNNYLVVSRNGDSATTQAQVDFQWNSGASVKAVRMRLANSVVGVHGWVVGTFNWDNTGDTGFLVGGTPGSIATGMLTSGYGVFDIGRPTAGMVVGSQELAEDVDLRKAPSFCGFGRRAQVDLKGHKLILTGTVAIGTATVTDTVGGGELHVDVPSSTSCDTRTLNLTGKLRLVKDGAGTLETIRTGQTYTGGTVVAGGTVSNSAVDQDRTLGATTSEIRVDTGATMKQATQNLNQHQYVLNGGTLYRINDSSINDAQIQKIRLTADSYLKFGHNCGIIGGGYSECMIDLGGHTLHFEGSTNNQVWFINTTMSAGTLDFYNVNGYFEVCNKSANPGLRAPEVSFINAGTARIAAPMTVKDFTTAKAQTYGSFTSTVTVYGRFKSTGTTIPNTLLADGATFDISNKTGVWDITSASWAGTLSFAANGHITVDTGTRALSKDLKLVNWSVQPSGTKFSLPEGTATHFRLSSRADGLYVIVPSMVIYVR